MKLSFPPSLDISCINKPLMHFPPLHSGLSEGHSSCLMHPKKVLHEIHKVLHKIHKLHKNHSGQRSFGSVGQQFNICNEQKQTDEQTNNISIYRLALQTKIQPTKTLSFSPT